jgi:hypothetical protein
LAQRELRDKLLDAARRREIDDVLVWRLDRWERSLADLVVTFKELAELGVVSCRSQKHWSACPRGTRRGATEGKAIGPTTDCRETDRQNPKTRSFCVGEIAAAAYRAHIGTPHLGGEGLI